MWPRLDGIKVPRYGVGDSQCNYGPFARLDAAFVWGKNKKAYFFAGDEYWRYRT